jgi:hypothetical protein
MNKTCQVRHRSGRQDIVFPIDRLGELLDELQEFDAEHLEVAVEGATFAISVFASGRCMYADVVDHEATPKFCGPLSRSDQLRLMRAAAEDDARVVAEFLWVRK